MIIEYTEGCICDSLTIDDKQTKDMQTQDLQDVICKLVKSESDISTLQNILINLAYSQGEYKDLGYCEQCGDYISSYTIETNN